MNNFFKLFASCIPVRGVSRSTLCDMQRGQIRFIPNDLCDLLLKFESSTFNEILLHYGKEHERTLTEYFEFLVENEFGFWCEDPSLFPNIDNLWESASIIENGIIDVNQLSNHNFEHIFNEYSAVGCNALEIRFFDYYPLSELKSILLFLETSRISTVNILLKYSDSFDFLDLLSILNTYVRVNAISIHSAPPDKLNGLNKNRKISFFETEITSNNLCGNIGMKYFVVDQDTFFESQNYNTCLNKKVSIDVNGDVKNCPSLRSVYGNIKRISLKKCLETTTIRDLWSTSKEQIETCKECEFRHVCTDCRAFLNSDNSKEKPEKCKYNPLTMEWG